MSLPARVAILTEPILVDNEIRRILRSNGMFICLDSLNQNLVYRANCWLHYIRGNRSKSTLKRMPKSVRIRDLIEGFSTVDVYFWRNDLRNAGL